ncbi:hypothetical protein HDV05_003878 [Chytridiales sp. JEL 0842]|nr:hypothetical protein HDV05_003878 [Chytridiales sp. JEL 0842]
MASMALTALLWAFIAATMVKVYMPHTSVSTHLVGGINDWTTVKTYTSIVSGPGPFLVAINASANGTIAGIAAAVTVDDVWYTSTGVADSKFRLKAVKNWKEGDAVDTKWMTHACFSEDGWIVATGEPRTSEASRWGDVEKRVANAAGGAGKVRMAWAPDSSADNSWNFARVVITPPDCHEYYKEGNLDQFETCDDELHNDEDN